MNRMVLFVVALAGASCFFSPVDSARALTPEQVVTLRNAGVSDQTIQLMIRQEQDAIAGNADDPQIRKEIKDKDGKAVIIYSTGRPSGNSREDKQTEKAWEMLRTIIIDNRRP